MSGWAGATLARMVMNKPTVDASVPIDEWQLHQMLNTFNYHPGSEEFREGSLG